MQDFRKLEVWRKAYAVARGIYEATAKFPAAERFGLTSQMRRAVVSIPANIAEGCGRDSDAQMQHFLEIAMGSACELECHLLLARDFGFVEPQPAHSLGEALRK